MDITENTARAKSLGILFHEFSKGGLFRRRFLFGVHYVRIRLFPSELDDVHISLRILLGLSRLARFGGGAWLRWECRGLVAPAES